MKKIFSALKSLIIALALTVGLSFAFATWTGPLSAPPNCVAGNPGCDAPINVGSIAQEKSGPLSLVNLFVNNLYVPAGASAGKVLTAVDATGLASWQTPTGGTCTPGTSGADFFTATGAWPVPAGVTSVRVRIWGAGGNGGASPGLNTGGGGGGGGAYGEKLISIPSGATSLQVAIGGPGGTTSVGGTLAVVGNGQSGSTGSAGGAGGAGGVVSGSGWLISSAGGSGGAGGAKVVESCSGNTFTQDGPGGAGGTSYTPSTSGIGGVEPVCRFGPYTQPTNGTVGGGGGGGEGDNFGTGGTGKVVIEYTSSGGCSGGPTASPTPSVSKITAGSGITVTPASGTGDVTINSTNSTSGGFTNVAVFDYASASGNTTGVTGSNGSYSFIVPTGISKIKVQMWGGGAAARSQVAYTALYIAGGGGGGYSEGFLSVNSGASIAVIVGSAGRGRDNTTDNFDGGNTSVSTTMSASGGKSATWGGNDNFIPGDGGVGQGGYLNLTGGKGLIWTGNGAGNGSEDIAGLAPLMASPSSSGSGGNSRYTANNGVAGKVIIFW